MAGEATVRQRGELVRAVISQELPAARPPGAAPPAESSTAQGFTLRLHNFEGPFDLLLTLISQRRLDVTEVALSQVTDDFISYTKAMGADVPLEQTTQFLVVAATLLDLKAARLLPAGEVDDAEDLALLEARDLLFARLLQYRAFKQVAQLLAELEAAALRRYPRAATLEPRYVALLPEVDLGVDAAALAQIAAAAFQPRPAPEVGLGHLHAARVSVPEQAALILGLLRDRGVRLSFPELIAGCELPVEIVARFLALLELYREKAVEFEQPEPLGPLMVGLTNPDAEVNGIDEYDE